MQGITKTHKLLRRLNSGVRIMILGAHPDDEPSWQLAYFGQKLGARQHIVIVTRGESGQNHIGSERGNHLGALRTQEMATAALELDCSFRMLATPDNTFQDFGYVKTAETTFEHWDKSTLLEEITAEIKRFRPHIVIACFLDVPTEHGHHRAINQLALECVDLAAAGDNPWEVAKIYAPSSLEESSLAVPVGDWDPVLGMSYAQLGEVSRQCHQSQKVSRIRIEGPEIHYLKRLDSEEKTDSIFDGLEDVVRLWPGPFSAQVQEIYNNVCGGADLVKRVHHLLAEVRLARLESEGEQRIIYEQKEKDLTLLARAAAQITMRVESERLACPGQELRLRCLIHSGVGELTDLQLEVHTPWASPIVTEKSDFLVANGVWEVGFALPIPGDAPYAKLYRELSPRICLSYEVDGIRVFLEEPVDLFVIPPITGHFTSPFVVANTREAKIPVLLQLKNNSSVRRAFQVRLGQLVHNLTLASQEETEIQLVLEAGSFDGGVTEIVPEIDGRPLNRLTAIAYPHIAPTFVLEQARSRVLVGEITIPDALRIGYVHSGQERVAEVLQLLGINVTLISDQHLLSGDFSDFDVIVLGIMAYKSRPALVAANSAVKEFMRNGGHLVVQYHRPFDNWDALNTSPFPLEIGYPSKSWRVTDPQAAVHYLTEDHPFFHTPHKLTETDWQDWIRERGLYFPMNWDQRYTCLVEMADRGERPLQSGILTAKVGAGKYTYTSLAWHYQLEYGVIGAIRGFINLLWPY